MFAQAQVQVQRQSILGWMFDSLGLFYSFALISVGLLLFVGGCLVVTLSRRPGVIASFMPFLLLPWMIGLFGAVHGAMSAFQVIAMSPSSPKPAEMAQGVSMSLFCVLAGIAVSFPGFFVLSIGLFFRTVRWRSD